MSDLVERYVHRQEEVLEEMLNARSGIGGCRNPPLTLPPPVMQSTTSNHKSLSPLESLAQSTAFTLKVHAGMIMSIDTKLERISDNVEKLTASQAETNTKMDRLTANVDKVAGTVTQLSAVVQMLAGIVQ